MNGNFGKIEGVARRGITIAMMALVAACAMDKQTVTSTPPASIGELQRLAPDDRPRIAVLEFCNKSNMSSANQIGTGMSDMLVTAMVQLNAFTMIERAQIGAIDSEQFFSNSGRFNPETAAQIGKLEGVDFFAVGAITEFEGDAAKAGLDVRVPLHIYSGDWISVIFTFIQGMFKQSHLAIDTRLIDVRTGRIVHANSIEGSPREFDGMFGGGWNNLMGSFGGGVKQPMEKAVRACIAKAAGEIATGITKDGWVPSHKLPPPTPTEVKTDPSVIKLTIADDPSFVRKSAADNSVKLKTLRRGDEVELLDETGKWLKVKCEDGTIGYTLKSNIEGE